MGILLPIGGVVAAVLIAAGCVQVLKRRAVKTDAAVSSAPVFAITFFMTIVCEMIAFWYWLKLVPIDE